MTGGTLAKSDEILRRIQSEFLEMPGLRLTCAQAQRLWALDGETCRELLERLVDAKFLAQPERGMYGRLTDGRAELTPLPRSAERLP